MTDSAGELIVLGMNLRAYDSARQIWNMKWLNALAGTWVDLGPEELGGVRFDGQSSATPLKSRWPTMLLRVPLTRTSPQRTLHGAARSRMMGRPWSEFMVVEAYRIERVGCHWKKSETGAMHEQASASTSPAGVSGKRTLERCDVAFRCARGTLRKPNSSTREWQPSALRSRGKRNSQAGGSRNVRRETRRTFRHELQPWHRELSSRQRLQNAAARLPSSTERDCHNNWAFVCPVRGKGSLNSRYSNVRSHTVSQVRRVLDRFPVIRVRDFGIADFFLEDTARGLNSRARSSHDSRSRLGVDSLLVDKHEAAHWLAREIHGHATFPAKCLVIDLRVDSNHETLLHHADAHLAVDHEAQPAIIRFSSKATLRSAKMRALCLQVLRRKP